MERDANAVFPIGLIARERAAEAVCAVSLIHHQHQRFPGRYRRDRRRTRRLQSARIREDAVFLRQPRIQIQRGIAQW